MRERLGASLAYVVEQLSARLPLNRPAIDGLLRRIVDGPVRPLVFGAYYEIVLAAERQALDEAERLIADLLRLEPAAGGLHVLDLPASGASTAGAIYRRLFTMDPSTPLELRAPPAAAAREARHLLDQARALMRRGAPALGAEVDVLVREVVLAVGPGGPDALAFDGASSFMLWGAVLLNAERPQDDLDMVEALAHESGHNLLFGLCADGPLVSAEDIERYPSPLRVDRRPMDGIVHATFVTARMCWAMSDLLGAGVLDAGRADRARAAAESHRAAFFEGLETIDRHAELTALGAGVVDAARHYMEHGAG